MNGWRPGPTMLTGYDRWDLGTEQRMTLLQADYYEQLLAGPDGYPDGIRNDVECLCPFNVTGRLMGWDQRLADRTREIEARRGIKPVLGIDIGCWEIAAKDLIAELRSTVSPLSRVETA